MATLFNRSCFLLLVVCLFSACEDRIYPDLDDGAPVVVVDAWINSKSEIQLITLSYSQPYFYNNQPQPVSGADVTVTSENGTVARFIDQGNGQYAWMPSDSLSFFNIGAQYLLEITANGNTYTASSTMGDAPAVDSVTYTYEEANGIFDEQYIAEFWSRDLIGEDNTYWIKTFWNGQELNKPEELNIAWDAGFSEGGGIDGLIFIPPIRQGVTPASEEDEDGNFIGALKDGDSLYVEVHSITNEAFTFLSEMRIQIDRPGGFAELFAQPLSNLPTNISSSDKTETVLGFFNVALVKGNGRKLNAALAKRK